jgi:hypothetical protein
VNLTIKYDDPISTDEIDFDENTTVYVVSCRDRYSIRAVSCSLGQLSKDPTTGADVYWLLNAQNLIDKIEAHPIIFPDGKLTSTTLTAEQITTCTGLDITTTRSSTFNTQLGRQFVGNWAADTTQAWGNETSSPTFFSPASHPHSIAPHPSLTHSQDNALRELQPHGLTAEMLLNLIIQGQEFDHEHCHALEKLVTDRHFTIANALAEINGLSSDQAMGIKNGLTRSDVLTLNNYHHIAALAALKPKGLTIEMLLNLNTHGQEFDHNHSWSLQILVEDRHFTIENALAEINGLSNDKVWAIHAGLTRSEALTLNNPYHLATLPALKSRGLTAEMLLNLNTQGQAFDNEHCGALQKLVTDRHFTVAAALEEINGLSKDQVEEIKDGLTRSDVLRSPANRR